MFSKENYVVLMNTMKSRGDCKGKKFGRAAGSFMKDLLYLSSMNRRK